MAIAEDRRTVAGRLSILQYFIAVVFSILAVEEQTSHRIFASSSLLSVPFKLFLLTHHGMNLREA